VEIVVAGNPTIDVIYTHDGVARRFGGSIYYAAHALSALGARVEVVGVASPDVIQELREIFERMGVRAHLIAADSTTTFELDYRVRPRAVRLVRRPSVGIRSVEGSLVILSPVYDELKDVYVRAEKVAADLQGYLRSNVPPPDADLVHFSIDDIQLEPSELVQFVRRWPYAVYTLGEDGAYVVIRGSVYYVNSARVSVEDVTGCGDVFLAVLSYLHFVQGLDVLSAACEASMYVAGFLLTRRVVKHEFNCNVQLLSTS